MPYARYLFKVKAQACLATFTLKLLAYIEPCDEKTCFFICKNKGAD